MKLGKYVALAVAAAALLVTTAMAADNQGSITFASPTQIGSQQLKAGDYKVQWDGSGSSVQVKFLQRGKVVATSTASLVEQKTAVPTDQAVVKTEDNGARALQEIDFAKHKVSLMFGENQTAGGQ